MYISSLPWPLSSLPPQSVVRGPEASASLCQINRISGPTPVLLNQNLWFNEIPRGFVLCVSECSRIFFCFPCLYQSLFLKLERKTYSWLQDFASAILSSQDTFPQNWANFCPLFESQLSHHFHQEALFRSLQVGLDVTSACPLRLHAFQFCIIISFLLECLQLDSELPKCREVQSVDSS